MTPEVPLAAAAAGARFTAAAVEVPAQVVGAVADATGGVADTAAAVTSPIAGATSEMGETVLGATDRPARVTFGGNPTAPGVGDTARVTHPDASPAGVIGDTDTTARVTSPTASKDVVLSPGHGQTWSAANRGTNVQERPAVSTTEDPATGEETGRSADRWAAFRQRLRGQGRESGDTAGQRTTNRDGDRKPGRRRQADTANGDGGNDKPRTRRGPAEGDQNGDDPTRRKDTNGDDPAGQRPATDNEPQKTAGDKNPDGKTDGQPEPQDDRPDPRPNETENKADGKPDGQEDKPENKTDKTDDKGDGKGDKPDEKPDDKDNDAEAKAREKERVQAKVRAALIGQNYYDVLGIHPDATPEETRAAYKKLSRKYHPDANKGDLEAEEYYKAVTEAYGGISDEGKRNDYNDKSYYGDNGRRVESWNKTLRNPNQQNRPNWRPNGQGDGGNGQGDYDWDDWNDWGGNGNEGGGDWDRWRQNWEWENQGRGEGEWWDDPWERWERGGGGDRGSERGKVYRAARGTFRVAMAAVVIYAEYRADKQQRMYENQERLNQWLANGARKPLLGEKKPEYKFVNKQVKHLLAQKAELEEAIEKLEENKEAKGRRKRLKSYRIQLRETKKSLKHHRRMRRYISPERAITARVREMVAA